MKKLANLLLRVAVVMLIVIGTWSGPVLAGSIVLTGHDPDFHAAFSEAGEITFNQRAIAYVMDPAFNAFKAGGVNKFLFVESQIPVPGGHVDGLGGLAVSGYTLGTDFDMATAATLNIALSQLGTTYSALVVASDFGGILTQAELNILNANSAGIISFLNAGGGLYAMAESNTGAGLTPGGGQFGFLPFATTSTAISFCGSISVTPFGASLGFTNFNTCADHNLFTGTFGLSVIDTLPSGEIISLAGRGVTTPGGVSAVPEPSSLLLMGSGLAGVIGFGMRKRRTSL